VGVVATVEETVVVMAVATAAVVVEVVGAVK
jgi:hypothetical protein